MSAHEDDQYEEEIEVTDDEIAEQSEAEEEEAKVEEAKVEEAKPAPVTPSKKPGKVNPSKQVKDMELKSPESVAKSSGPVLPVGKNPFPTFGTWTQKAMSEIEIVVPVFVTKNETTNDLTRASRPEARYWKAPITFRRGIFTSETLRFDNVLIPYHTGKGYGSSFIYLCLPGFAAERFAEAGKTRRPTRATEKSLVPDKNRWWKVANKVGDSFGVINKTTKKFHTKSLESVFDASKSGVRATVILNFFFKAATESMEALKPTTPATIGIEIEKAFIIETDVNVEMPTRVVRAKTKVEPVATAKDVATDSLMKRLDELGL